MSIKIFKFIIISLVTELLELRTHFHITPLSHKSVSQPLSESCWKPHTVLVSRVSLSLAPIGGGRDVLGTPLAGLTIIPHPTGQYWPLII